MIFTLLPYTPLTTDKSHNFTQSVDLSGIARCPDLPLYTLIRYVNKLTLNKKEIKE